LNWERRVGPDFDSFKICTLTPFQRPFNAY
jgi:hypothetical protein